MNIITHDWNGYGISQLKQDSRIAKFDIPVGYVNATQMCKANGREWSAYARRKTSKAYWEGLANDLRKCISSLIIQIDAYGDEQATWVHPEIAVDLAQWVSVPFKIWANRNLTRVISGETIEPDSFDDTPILSHSPKEIAEAIASVFCLGTIDPGLIQGLIANEIGNAHPQLKPHMEAAKKLLPLPVEQELLTVTDLAKKYIHETGKPLSKSNTDQGNAIALNKLLIEIGLQVKNTLGDPSYLPTEAGTSYCKVVLQEGKDSNKTCQQLRWYPSVINHLKGA